jgi:hypothetical protein
LGSVGEGAVAALGVGAALVGAGTVAALGVCAVVGGDVVAASATVASARQRVAWGTRVRQRWARAATLGQQPRLEAMYAAAQRVNVGETALAEFLCRGEASAAARAD